MKKDSSTTTFHSDDNEIITSDEDKPNFEMTHEEVEYFVDSISREYLSKDTYYLAINLVRRMREYLECFK